MSGGYKGNSGKAEKLFGKILKERKKLHTAALLALLALLTVSAYFLADIVDTMIGRSLDAAAKFTSPHERDAFALHPRRELSDYSSILERGFFGDGKGPSGSPASAVSTFYKLIGTVEGEKFAGAVLDDGAGQAFYRVNRKLSDGSVIVKVMRDKVALRRPDGVTLSIEIVDDAKIVPVQKNGAGVKRLSNDKFMVDQKEVLASTENMSKILTQARAVPYLEQGKTVGFRISEIVPGSVYEKIGLRNGDVIQRVNAQELDNPAKFFRIYQGLRNERNLAVDLIRNGQRQTLSYEIR